MLSYRHSFHAGNFADVVKHVVLVALLQALLRKATPLYVQDTHAGRGMYDLDSEEARQTGESADGIGRIWQCREAPTAVQQYLEVLRECNPGLPAPKYYPGSPVIAQALLRRQDRLLLTELHPQDHAQLVRQFHDDKRVHVHKQDAYQGLKAFLPPTEKRGLILIDPPYERKDEYTRVVTALQSAYARWRQGVFAIWYPIMSRGLQNRFLQEIAASDIRKILHSEFRIAPFAAERQFVGCGMLLVNPPWQIETALTACLEWLRSPLQQGSPVSVQTGWLVPE
jgi:23S rRNA (adenine2030-N6)-methyltransferase